MPKPLCYSGPTGSGKTTRLMEYYKKLIASRIPSNRILVLVMNRTQINRWKREIQPEKCGPLLVVSFFGWVQRELTRFWPLVCTKIPPGRQAAAPLFMTVETSHYLLELLLEKVLPSLKEIVSPPHRLAAQVMDNIDKAAVNGIPIHEAAKRLQDAFPGDDTRRENFPVVQELIDKFYSMCLETRVFNYGIAVELYSNYLLTDPHYQDQISSEIDYLIVDNLEETRPAAQEFIRWLIQRTKEAVLAYTDDGGHARFFGADPEGARDLLSLCRVHHLEKSYTCSDTMLKWSDSLAKDITREPHDNILPDHTLATINAELRSDMIADTAREIVKLVYEGTPPHRIAVIAPHVDKVLEYALEMELRKDNINVNNLTRSKRLIDEPYAVVLTTLAILAHPEWELRLRKGDLHETICHLLQLDPVRSSLLINNCAFPEPPWLKPMDAVTRRRCGYLAGEKYDKLLGWLENYRAQDPLPVDAFLQKAFADLVAPLLPKPEQLNACRQILKSAVRFCEVARTIDSHLTKYTGTRPQPGKMFIDMVLKGTIASEKLEEEKISENAVILSTPYAFLLTQTDVDYQFWLDASSPVWFPGDAKELSNPHVFSKHWSGGTWSDDRDVLLRKQNCARTVRALARKIKKGIVLAISTYNTRGFEQEGPLPEHVARVFGGNFSTKMFLF